MEVYGIKFGSFNTTTPGNEYIKMQGTSHTTIENNQDPATHYVSFK